MNSNPTIFLDLDGVMVTSNQHYGKNHKKYDGHPFDSKCVKVLNEIIEKTNPIIIISSDWKLYFTQSQLSQIFVENGVNSVVDGITPDSWGVQFTSLKQLEECRAFEIQSYVMMHEVTKWVAIDDLNLFPWIPVNFVWCTRSSEGLKQSGVKDKIINILK